MGIAKAVQYLFGYIDFEVGGAEPESFMSAAMHANVDLWAVRKIDACTLRARSRAINLKTIRELCAQTGNSLRLIRSSGFPVAARRYKNRFGFIAGVILFLALISYLSSFVWRIDISGDYTSVQKSQILAILAQNGCSVGSSVASQDEQALKYAIMRGTTVGGVTVNFRGTVALIDVDNSVQKPNVLSRTYHCNIIAKEDGIITDIIAYNGVAEVEEGQSVRKGQLLVNGVYDSKIMGARLVHAHAKVEAQVLKTLSTEVSYKQSTRLYTGSRSSYSYVQILGKKIPLTFNTESPYEDYITDVRYTPLVIGDDFELPVVWGQYIYSEVQSFDVMLTYEQALQRARAELDEMERVQMREAKIQDKIERITETDTGVKVEYVYSVIEDIGVEQEIYSSSSEE